MRPQSGGRRSAREVDAQPLERALDLADGTDGDARIERGRLELGVSEQHLNHANIDVLLEQMGGDPNNVEALIGSAIADSIQGSFSFVADPAASFAAAEAKLTKALSSVPDHALGHMTLGLVYIFTKRAKPGIAECEHALALDRNLANAHFSIGVGKTFIGRAEETEAHIVEALRLSPRDPTAHIWMNNAGLAKLFLGSYEQAVVWCQRAGTEPETG
jgi:tetratricopeptide (TPR) repeat protein